MAEALVEEQSQAGGCALLCLVARSRSQLSCGGVRPALPPAQARDSESLSFGERLQTVVGALQVRTYASTC